LCPDAKWQREVDKNRLDAFCNVAMMETLWHPFTIYIEDDGEALAFMMIQDTFIKQNKDELKLMMILENPDWDDIMAEAETIRELERNASTAVSDGANSHVNSSKRKFDKFKSELLPSLRSLPPEFKTKFTDFEKDYLAAIESYRAAQKDKGRELNNAKNRMKNRLNKYVVKKVKRR
jgi:hypothetical protein